MFVLKSGVSLFEFVSSQPKRCDREVMEKNKRLFSGGKSKDTESRGVIESFDT